MKGPIIGPEWAPNGAIMGPEWAENGPMIDFSDF